MSDKLKTKVLLTVECEATGEHGDFGTLADMAAETLRSAIMADCDDVDEQGRCVTKYKAGGVAIGEVRIITSSVKRDEKP